MAPATGFKIAILVDVNTQRWTTSQYEQISSAQSQSSSLQWPRKVTDNYLQVVILFLHRYSLMLTRSRRRELPIQLLDLPYDIRIL